MGPQATEFDFRRPSKLGRDVTRGLELLHEVFARRVATTWGSELRSYVQIDEAGIVQMPYDDVIRSMPNPNVLVTGEAHPLPGAFVVEFDLQLGLLLVDRLLGADGVGDERSMRRPSEVELELLGHLGQQAVSALADVLEPIGCTDPRMRSVDVNPQLVQVAAPSDPAMLVAFQVTVSGAVEARGTLSVVYPTNLMSSLLDYLGSLRTDPNDRRVDPAQAEALLGGLGSAPVDVAVQLSSSNVDAESLRVLQVGDVLRLDHRVGRPAIAVVGGQPVLEVNLGKVGPRRAAQVIGWHTEAEEPPASSSLLSNVAGPPALMPSSQEVPQ